MKYKAKITCNCEMIVWIDEDDQGNQEIPEIQEVLNIDDFEVKERLS